jgi:hypothetical protein
VTCQPGTPVNSFLCHVADMSADMSATCRPDRHMSVVLTLVLTRQHPTLPAKAGQNMGGGSLQSCGHARGGGGGHPCYCPR